jgi:hypothetical protein
MSACRSNAGKYTVKSASMRAGIFRGTGAISRAVSSCSKRFRAVPHAPRKSALRSHLAAQRDVTH